MQVLFDLGVVSSKEPFHRLVSQGMILGEVEYTLYRNTSGEVVDEHHPEAIPERVRGGARKGSVAGSHSVRLVHHSFLFLFGTPTTRLLALRCAGARACS